MDRRNLIDAESIVFLEGSSPNAVLRELVEALPIEDSRRDDVLEAVLEREGVMSTGIGHGVAVPHARTAVVSGVHAALGIAREPLPFDAVDGRPVRIFILIVADPRAADAHLKALAWISGILNDETRRLALENATTAGEVLDALEGGDTV